MINVKSVLDRYKIRTHVMNMGVQDIGLLIREADNPIVYSQKFIFDLFSMQIDIPDEIYAGILCKHIVKSLIENQCQVDDEKMLMIVDAAEIYTKQYCADPNNSYLWSQDPEPKKKKTKQDRVLDLYLEKVVNAEQPISNIELVDLICIECNTDKVGARSLLFNAKKSI